MKFCVIGCLVCSILFGQILYEEHFTDGAMQLDWHPWFYDTLGIGDSMQVISDPTTPEGDGWAGKISNEYMGAAGLTYAGAADLEDYSIEAYIYTTVTTGTGPYNGIAIRMDTTSQRFYRFVSDFDSIPRLRLALYIEGFPMPTVIALRDWDSLEVPGGVPTTSSWHKFKLKMIADSIWCFYDDVMLPDCPILNDSIAQGFFGVYLFNFSGVDSTKCDSIIVKAEGTGICEYDAGKLTAFTIYPNPFSSATNIRFSILDSRYMIQNTTLNIYDAAGRLVRSFRITPDALHSTLSWDGRDAAGNNLAPGVYFISDAHNRQMEKVVKVD